MRFDDYDYAPPRRVGGGIRAKTARGAIGASWWSRRFLEVLESFALGTRLTRGRAYARAGQVLSLTIAAGRVTATVQGSRPKPYQVGIGLARISELSWARIEIMLAEQALYSAQLLAGELPPDLERVFAEAGAPLFPAAVQQLEMRCSCPDAAVPCKHLAATCYLLAEAFDADPFQILQWRGRSREQLLDRLRTLRAGAGTGIAAEPGRVAPGRAAPGRAAPGRAGRVRVARPPDASSPAPAPAPAASAPAASAASDPAASAASDPAASALPQLGPVGLVGGAALALADIAELPLTDCLDRYWLQPQPLPARPPTLVTDADLLLRQLPPPGAAIGGDDLVQRLRSAYHGFSSVH